METQINQHLTQMTTTESVVLRNIAAGATSKEIANSLQVSERTIEKHRSHIIRKLGLNGAANSLTRWALINRNIILMPTL